MVQEPWRHEPCPPARWAPSWRVRITKASRGWGITQAQILLLFWGRAGRGTSLLPGLPACPAALSGSCTRWVPSAPPRAPDSLLA